MAGLTASGIGSGLDISGLVSQLMSLEQRPLTALATKEASFQAKLSAYGQLKSVLSNFQSAADKLDDSALFAATKASVSTGAAFSATSSTTATAGGYSVEVLALAREQRIATSATSTFAPAAGNLTITFGSVSGGVFTPGAESPKTLNFTGSTLAEFRDAINEADLGVTASIVNNGSAEQLVLKGASTGAAQAFEISGTTGLTYDPTVAGTSSDSVYRLAAAQDAQVDVDGIVVSRATNTLDDVIDGVTLTLAKAEPGTTSTLTVAADKSGATSAINAFVKAYNDLNTTIKNLTAFNAETRSAATLTGDSTARSIQTQLRTMFGDTLSGLTGANRLSDIGISFARDGTLSVDSSKLATALADDTLDVASFFAGNGTTMGLASRVSERIDGFIGTDGLISGRTDGINSSIKSLDKQREALTRRLEQIEARYLAQFTALDSLVASFTQTSNYLTQQLATLPGASSST